MKKTINIFIVIFILSNSAISQIDSAKFEEKMEMKVKQNDYDWAYKNFFLDYKLSAVSEYLLRKPLNIEYVINDITNDDTIHFEVNSWMLGIMGFTLEPRINFATKRHSSFHVKAPISINFSVTRIKTKAKKSWYGGSHNSRENGFFSFNAPILIGWSTGLNSNYSSAKKRGFSISAGYQFTFNPLLGGNDPIKELYEIGYENDNNEHSSIPYSDFYSPKKIIGIPVVQIDFYKLSKKNKIRGTSISFCPYGSFYIKIAKNFTFSDK